MTTARPGASQPTVPAGLSDPSTWVRLRGSGRDAALVAVGVLVVGALAAAVDLADPVRSSAAVLVGAACAALVWSVYVRPELQVAPSGLLVVTALRTVQIGWEDVAGFDPRLMLVVRRHSGRAVQVAVVAGKARDAARGRASVPGVVASLLTDRLARLRGGELMPSTASPPPPSRAPWVEPALVSAGALVAALVALLARR